MHIEEVLKLKNWKEYLENQGIQVTPADIKETLPQGFKNPIEINELKGLFCASYNPRDPRCDYSKTIVRECRGIIFEPKTQTIWCRAFDKFGNWFESYAADIDWSTARIEEKIDGQIIKLWYKDGTWIWSTNRRANADASPARLDTRKTTLDLIKEAKNYKNINWKKLNKNYTYIFELTSPYNQIVIPYTETKLTHIGTRNTKSGQEYNEDIGIEKPKTIGLGESLDEWIHSAEQLNNDNNITSEGFVVVDNNWNRIKIKSPKYLEFHHSIATGNLSPKTAYPALITHDEELIAAWSTHPVIKEQLETYTKRYEQGIKHIQEKANTIQDVLTKTKNKQQAFNSIEPSAQKAIAVKMAFNNISINEALSQFTTKAVIKAMEEEQV